MNWKLISQLSLLGFAMAVATVYTLEVPERFGDQTVVSYPPLVAPADADPFAGAAVGSEQGPAVDRAPAGRLARVHL